MRIKCSEGKEGSPDQELLCRAAERAITNHSCECRSLLCVQTGVLWMWPTCCIARGLTAFMYARTLGCQPRVCAGVLTDDRHMISWLVSKLVLVG